MTKKKKKKNKNRLLWIGVGLFVFFISCLSVLFVITLSIMNNNKLQKTGGLTKEESIGEERDIFIISCAKKESKPYSGYAVGDTIDCTLKYNEANELFKAKDSILDSITFHILPSKSIQLKKAYAMNTNEKNLQDYLKLEKQGNELTIKNTKRYDSTERDSLSQEGRPLIYQDSLRGIELHMEFMVNSNLPSNKMVEVNLEEIEFSIKDVINDAKELYKTNAKYSFDTTDNDPFYCKEKNIYKLEKDMQYNFYDTLPCKESSCACGSKDAMNTGHIDVIENSGNQNSSYRVIYNIQTKEVWKEFKNLYFVKIEDKVYGVANSKESGNEYSIILLNEEKVLKTFKTEGSKKVLFASKEGEILDIGINDGTHLKFDPKKKEFTK